MTVAAVSAACSAYDAFADFYATYWGPVLRDHALRAFDELLLPRLRKAGDDGLPAGSYSRANEGQPDLSRRPQAGKPGPLDHSGLRILDLCCGSGDLAALLAARGYDVLGLDGSPRMLERAQIAAPGARFRLADARSFVVEQPFDGVLCMYDSLNHLASLEELRQTLSHVHAALRPAGMFLFDLNMRDGFEARFQGSFGFSEAGRSLLVSATFDEEEGIGRYALTLFRRQAETETEAANKPDRDAAARVESDVATKADSDADVESRSRESSRWTANDNPSRDRRSLWTRTDALLEQRCFEEHQVRAALAQAGFEAVSVFDAEAALGMDGHFGRAMFLARRSG